MNINILIEKIFSLHVEDYRAKTWIYDLVKSRKNDKNGEYTKGEDFMNFVSDSLLISEAFKS